MADPASKRNDFYTANGVQSLAQRRREILKKFMDSRNLKAKAWAESAKISPNTLYNFFNGRSSSLSQEILEKLAFAARVSLSKLLDEGDDTYIAARTIQIRGSVGLTRTKGDDEFWAVQQTGDYNNGVWEPSHWLWARIPDIYESWYMHESRPENEKIKNAFTYPIPEDAYGMMVFGHDMNLIYPPNTLLIVAPVERPSSLLPGDRVISHVRWKAVQRMVVREYGFGPDGQFWLHPRTSHPEFQTPIRYLDLGEPRVIAKVYASYRPEVHQSL